MLNPVEQTFWQERWVEGTTGWDLQGPHPAFATVVKLLSACGVDIAGARVFVPGAGRAHDGAAFARLGAEVVAEDFAPGAVAAAQALYRDERGLIIRQGDATVVPAAEIGTWDIVFDRAMLCALRPELRGAFLDAVARRLRSGGMHVVLLFDQIPVTPERPAGSGPPFQITVADYRDLAGERFAVATTEDWTTVWPAAKGAAATDKPRQMSETVVLARRKNSASEVLR